MSRFSEYDDYEESFNNEAALYAANTRRALKGKRGQAFLKEMEAALVALPEKRLIEGAVCVEGQVCAIGALALKRQMDAGKDIKAALDWLEEEAPPQEEGNAEETANFALHHLGVMERLAFKMAHINDDGGYKETPEQRYERVLKWIRSKIGSQ